MQENLLAIYSSCFVLLRVLGFELSIDLPCILVVGREACLVPKPAKALEWAQWIRAMPEVEHDAVLSSGWTSPGKMRTSATWRPSARSSLFLLLIDNGKEIQLFA